MSTFILGDGAIAALSQLSATLKEKTKARVEELDRKSYEFYSPWMCVRPLLDGPIEDQDLLSYQYHGELVTDAQHLAAIQNYLIGQGRDLVEGLPVPFSDWPIMVDIETNRPDAIASFHEGRALLKSSPFLDALYPILVECVIPQNRERPSGFDTGLARGVIFRTFPTQRTGLLAGFQLAHAMGHQAAILLQSVDPLIDHNYRTKKIHYEVRKDERTADHAIVSAVALGYMAALSKAIYGDKARPFIADEHVSGYGESLPDAIRKAISSIRKGAPTTEFGKILLGELEDLAESC